MRRQLAELIESKSKISNSELWLKSEVEHLQKEVNKQRQIMDLKDKRAEEKEKQLNELNERNRLQMQERMQTEENLLEART